MNEPKAPPVSSLAGACAPHREVPVPREGLDMGQPRPPQPWTLIPAPLLRQDPVPGRLLHRGLLSPHSPAPSPAPSPVLSMGGRPCRAQPPLRACRPRPVSPGAAGAVERARGRGRLCGRMMVFSQPWLIPAASTAPLPVLLRRESRRDAVRPGSGDGGGQGCISCPSPAGGLAPQHRAALQHTAIHVHGRKCEAPGRRRSDAWEMLAGDGQGGRGHQDGGVMLCLWVLDCKGLLDASREVKVQGKA